MLKRFFELASLVLQYLVPFAAITYSYTKIWSILSKHTKPGNTKEKELLDDHKKREDMQKLIKQLQVNMMPENQGESRERASRYQSEINQGKIEEYKRRRKLRYASSVGGAGSVGQAQTVKARPKTAIGASVQVAMLKDNWNSLRD
jgi:hypothetical protein